MRLTLRTLLAYLDDVLEPAQAREIGEKIAEYKEAEDLVARIREVIRRRRIGAPELTGPGSGPDPNLVADYLENALPPAQVVELEQLCQRSDLHLAEIAACHKILTMVIGQPIDVDASLRERMYALGAPKAPVAEPEPEPTSQPDPMTTGMGNHRTVTGFEDGLPDYLKRGGISKGVWTTLLVLLLAVVWVGLVVSDQAIWSTTRPGQGTVALNGNGVVVPVEVELGDVPLPAGEGRQSAEVVPEGNAASQPSETSTPMAADSTPAENTSPAVAINPPPPPDRPETEPAMVPKVAATLPSAVTPAQVPPGQPAAAPPTIEPPRPVLEEASLTYAGGTGVTIVRQKEAMAWSVMGKPGVIRVGDEVAAPAPFRSRFSAGERLGFSLEPGTRLVRLERSEESDIAIGIGRGQLALTRPNASEEPVTIQLLIARQPWTVTLLEPGTRVGLEVIPPEPEGPVEGKDRATPSGGLSVVAGAIEIQRGDDEAMQLRAEDGWVPWPQESEPLNPHPGSAIPMWLVPDGIITTNAAKNLARMYEKEFLPDRTIVQSVGAVAMDRRASISELAVQTLSLIGQYKEVVPALRAENEEARLAAIKGLRQWLALHPESEDLLEQEVSRVFRDNNVNIVMRLLWGYSASDLQNVTTSRQLLNWMNDDEIAIRELAFYHVFRLTGRRYDYRANLPLPERKAAVLRWEDHLKRDGSLLPKEEAG